MLESSSHITIQLLTNEDKNSSVLSIYTLTYTCIHVFKYSYTETSVYIFDDYFDYLDPIAVLTFCLLLFLPFFLKSNRREHRENL